MKRIGVLEKNIKSLEKESKKLELEIIALSKKLKKDENILLRKDFGHKLKELYSKLKFIDRHKTEIAELEHKHKIKPKLKTKITLRKKKRF